MVLCCMSLQIEFLCEMLRTAGTCELLSHQDVLLLSVPKVYVHTNYYKQKLLQAECGIF